MYSELLKKIGTRSEQIDWLFEIDQLSKSIFTPTVISQQSSKIADNLRLFLDSNIEDRTDILPRKGLLSQISEQILAMDIVELRIAINLDSESQNSIVSWVKENISEACLVEFIYNPGLISGATISYKGNYIDLSFKTKFLDFFSKQSDWIRGYFEL